MKNLILTTLFLVIAGLAIAQSPIQFNYQAVARDAQGQALKNQAVSLKISLLEGSNTGTVKFEEIHKLTSSKLGILNLLIGKGQNQSGILSNLDWKNNKYWLKVEMDASGGSNYSLMSTTQLVSVPYALHAETATHVDDADADPNNEIQTLSFNTANNELSISNGNKITIPIGGTDADADPLNEIQTISKNGNTVTLSKNGGTFTDEVEDADASQTNEKITSMTLSASNILSITEPGNTQTVDLSPLAENNSPWTESGSNIYRNTGRVGINTNLPNANLAVGGSGHSGDAIYGESNATNGIGIYGYAPTLTGIGIYAYGGDYDFYAGNANSKSYFNGKVGIGIESPNSPLHIKTIDLNTPTIKLQGDYPWMGFYNDNDVIKGLLWYDIDKNNMVLNNNSTDGKLKFEIGYIDKMVINNDGDVGIGTSNPEADLHIYKTEDDTEMIMDSYSSANGTSIKLRNNVGTTTNDFFEFKLFSSDNSNSFPGGGGLVADAAFINASSETSSLAINSDNGPIRLMHAAYTEMEINDRSVKIASNNGSSNLYLDGDMEITNNTPVLHFKTDEIAKIESTTGSEPAHINIGTKGLCISPDGISYSGDYPFRVMQPGNYGLNIYNSNTENNWEFYVGNDGLRLYSNNHHRGTFDITTGAYSTISDRRLKTNIREMDNTLAKTLKLKPSRYEYINNNPAKKESIGFIAQDVQKLFPELVKESTDTQKDGMLTINYAGFGTIAIKAIQEQQVIIDLQNKKIENQQKEIDELKTRLDRIEELLK